MTDKELKTLFDSIGDFDDFNTKVIKRQDIILKDGFSIIFHDDLQPPAIDITVDYQKYSVDGLTFSEIINDILVENDILNNSERLRNERVTETQLRNEIFYLKDNIYTVHEEYIEYMFFSRDVASGHGTYLRKLQDLLRVFNNENILVINEHKISSRNDLKKYLKSVGFYFIDKDIP